MNYLILAVVAVTLIIVLWFSTQLLNVRAKLSSLPENRDLLDLLRKIDNEMGRIDQTISEMLPRLDAVEAVLPTAISRTGVIAYDAFGDIAGDLSRSVALLDQNGDGIVLSLLVGRNETRFFTKQVKDRYGVEPLSPEEEAAIDQALGE
tara:strand:+ start:105 stop:551 length:447 start_codon:yes stop_codon:yes gene_type:complete